VSAQSRALQLALTLDSDECRENERDNQEHKLCGSSGRDQRDAEHGAPFFDAMLIQTIANHDNNHIAGASLNQMRW
jgi:hypothetical protein